MKKIIALVLSLICVLSAGGCSSDTANESPSKNDMVTSDNAVMDQREITEWLIAKLKSEIAFEDNDILTFSNGQLYSIDIKSEETAEMLFQCIGNCRSVTDLTGAALSPEHLPILINGREIGTFEHIYSDYPETEQFFSFIFTKEDSVAFYEYVMALED